MNRRTLTWAALGLGALLVCWLLLPQNPTVLGWADSPVPTPTATQATSPEWVNFYGMSSTLDGQPLPIGAVVEAWTGGGRCGFFTVHTIGMYGLLPCYRSYEGSPGANPGDVISFTINGRPATPMGPDQPVWTSHGDRKQVELQAVGGPPTATPTLPSAPTATGTPVAPTPTGTVGPSPTWTPITPGPTASATWPPAPTWTPWPPPAPTWTPWPPPPTWPPWPPTPTPTPQPCWEAVVNGNFLSNQGWTISPDPRPATYTTEQWRSGGRAMFLGNRTQPDAISHSSIRQVVEIPAEAISARLKFWYWPWSEDTTGSDHQELALLDPATGHTIATVWRRVRANEEVWLSEEIDLLGHRGRRLELYFNVYNDGIGGRTAMYLDDVSLVICTRQPSTPLPPTPTAFPTWPVPPTAGPPMPGTPPPRPPGYCVELVQNGAFDPAQDIWRLGCTPYKPHYASDQYLSPPWSMYLGFNPGLPNRFSFSSVRQQVQIPREATTVSLVFWYFPISEPGAGTDEQQFVLLEPWGEGVIAKPWRAQYGTPVWQWQHVDLTAFRGRTLDIYFGVVNDGIGGRTAMYLDDVSLLACWPATPTPPSLPTATQVGASGGTGAPATPTLVSGAGGTPATLTLVPGAEGTPATPTLVPGEGDTLATPTSAVAGESQTANTRLFFIGLLVIVVVIGVTLVVVFKVR